MAKENIILNRSFNFSLQIIEIYKQLLEEKEYVLSKQLLRSATSIGANVEEAIAGISKRDFIAKMPISSKEARETRYWLRLLKEGKLTELELSPAIKEIEELINILTKIVKTSQSS